MNETNETDSASGEDKNINDPLTTALHNLRINNPNKKYGNDKPPINPLSKLIDKNTMDEPHYKSLLETKGKKCGDKYGHSIHVKQATAFITIVKTLQKRDIKIIGGGNTMHRDIWLSDAILYMSRGDTFKSMFCPGKQAGITKSFSPKKTSSEFVPQLLALASVQEDLSKSQYYKYFEHYDKDSLILVTNFCGDGIIDFVKLYAEQNKKTGIALIVTNQTIPDGFRTYATNCGKSKVSIAIHDTRPLRRPINDDYDSDDASKAGSNTGLTLLHDDDDGSLDSNHIPDLCNRMEDLTDLPLRYIFDYQQGEPKSGKEYQGKKTTRSRKYDSADSDSDSDIGSGGSDADSGGSDAGFGGSDTGSGGSGTLIVNNSNNSNIGLDSNYDNDLDSRYIPRDSTISIPLPSPSVIFSTLSSLSQSLQSPQSPQSPQKSHLKRSSDDDVSQTQQRKKRLTSFPSIRENLDKMVEVSRKQLILPVNVTKSFIKKCTPFLDSLLDSLSTTEDSSLEAKEDEDAKDIIRSLLISNITESFKITILLSFMEHISIRIERSQILSTNDGKAALTESLSYLLSLCHFIHEESHFELLNDIVNNMISNTKINNSIVSTFVEYLARIVAENRQNIEKSNALFYMIKSIASIDSIQTFANSTKILGNLVNIYAKHEAPSPTGVAQFIEN